MIENALPDDPTQEALRLTPLDSWHREQGARMVPFAGYAMPVQYPRRHRRAPALPHQGGIVRRVPHGPGNAYRRYGGGGAGTLVPGDIIGLKPARQRYTLLTNEAGGVIDDLMVANLGRDRLFVVVNASRKAVDLPHIAAALPELGEASELEDRALLALQGPLAAEVLGRLSPGGPCPALHGRRRDSGGRNSLHDLPVRLHRRGWIRNFRACRAMLFGSPTALAEQPEVAPAGLGARDSLRLEAGLCLYGNDIDELTTPVEAGLMWVVGKRRRTAWDFLGGHRDP